MFTCKKLLICGGVGQIFFIGEALEVKVLSGSRLSTAGSHFLLSAPPKAELTSPKAEAAQDSLLNGGQVLPESLQSSH